MNKAFQAVFWIISPKHKAILDKLEEPVIEFLPFHRRRNHPVDILGLRSNFFIRSIAEIVFYLAEVSNSSSITLEDEVPFFHSSAHFYPEKNL